LHLLQGQRRTTESVNYIGRSSDTDMKLAFSNFNLEELFLQSSVAVDC